MDLRKLTESNEKIEITLKNDPVVMEDEISLRELFGVVMKGKQFIAMFTLVAAVVALIGSLWLPGFLSGSDGQVKTAISYYYVGASQGVSPDGTPFDINEIRSPAVLKPVIDDLGLSTYGVTVERLRRNLSFEAIVPDEVVEKLGLLREVEDDELRLKEYEALDYNPNQFIVTFNLSRELGIPETMGREILDAVIRSYEGWFYTTYTDREILTNLIAEVDFANYDYPEIVSIFDRQLGIIYAQLDDKIAEDSDFRSRTTGLSFLELKQMVRLIDEIELNRSRSLIGAFNLTKDKDRLIKLYEYQIEQYDLLSRKKTDERLIINQMIDSYIKDSSAVIISSIGGEQPGVSLDYEDEYYNSLVEDYTEAGIAATDASNEIAFLQFKIARLNEDAVTSTLKMEAVTEVEELNEIIGVELTRWIDEINVTLAEYDQGRFYRSTLQQLTPAEIYKSGVDNLMLNLAIGLVLGLMLSVFIVFFRHAVGPESEK